MQLRAHTLFPPLFLHPVIGTPHRNPHAVLQRFAMRHLGQFGNSLLRNIRRFVVHDAWPKCQRSLRAHSAGGGPATTNDRLQKQPVTSDSHPSSCAMSWEIICGRSYLSTCCHRPLSCWTPCWQRKTAFAVSKSYRMDERTPR